ncbi:MAG: ATP-binding cassette domain-containing protein [Campylobacterota bacterium]|nr:ATP-binding cassette domain-containing protein [Campylobacterota bacterium]
MEIMQVKSLIIDIAKTRLVDIAFDVERSLALVGQSGSGKSLTLKALLGMLPESMELELDIEASFKLIRGETIAFVPQNPFTALSPLTKIRDQFFIKNVDLELLFKKVHLDITLLERFPPELSGGQLQRVVIAMALSSKPKLLLLDEPTTALDPKTRIVIINLLKSLQKELGFKMLFVSHDIASASQLCDSICVIREGSVQEQGAMQSVIQNPQQEYTKRLIEASFSQREFRV